MLAVDSEPILQHWTTTEPVAVPPVPATAAEVNACLALIEVVDIDATLAAHLAAATAELALLAGLPSRFGADDPPVAMVRMIAKITVRQPHAGGPHTVRLLDLLRGRRPQG